MILPTRFRLIPALLLAVCSACSGKDYPCRWFYVSRSLGSDSHVAEIEKLVQTASQHGLNGMVLAAGLDRLDRQGGDYLARLEKVRAICEEHNIEIIPSCFSAGYGWSILSYDRNLAAGIPVKDAVFVVRDGQARLVPDENAVIANGGFEGHNGETVTGYRFHDRPGDVSFVDEGVFHSGAASLRFENFGKYEHGHARVMQEIKVRPGRCYRIKCWVKTDGLEPKNAFKIQVLTADGRALAPWDGDVESTTDWRRVIMGFNSLEYDMVRIYLGVWGGKTGRFWVDDLSAEEVALLNVLRRPGTPLTVKSLDDGTIYEEGKDFAPVSDPRLNFRFDHDPPTIKILPTDRIKEGQQLSVSYFHGIGVNRGQVTICMSEPAVYEIWARQAKLMHKYLSPKRYLLSMDEVRAGGGCVACKSRGMTMGQILGDCITKQVEIIKNVNPQAEVWSWSDMLDANHNAHGDYYLVDGDFTGSWNHIPKDLGIVCWYYSKRNESLKFFSALGFATVAGAYYDGDTLENPQGWLDALDRTAGARGIMYTTWQNKYDLLAGFGDLVTKR
ncbi:MAG: carbohydrate binding domain-containing protein [Sedimentisphaerales bacterium]|nr:carbohydrate binding domain-containing protein [Sedimentisphaerales bacterium]